MNDTIDQKKRKPANGRVEAAAQHHDVSRSEKFAATQVAGDGIQGNPLKKNKSVDEKIAANIADRT